MAMLRNGIKCQKRINKILNYPWFFFSSSKLKFFKTTTIVYKMVTYILNSIILCRKIVNAFMAYGRRPWKWQQRDSQSYVSPPYFFRPFFFCVCCWVFCVKFTTHQSNIWHTLFIKTDWCMARMRETILTQRSVWIEFWGESTFGTIKRNQYYKSLCCNIQTHSMVWITHQ